MSELMRCLMVFTHSPFKVRLLLLQMICERLASAPRESKKNA